MTVEARSTNQWSLSTKQTTPTQVDLRSRLEVSDAQKMLFNYNRLAINLAIRISVAVYDVTHVRPALVQTHTESLPLLLTEAYVARHTSNMATQSKRTHHRFNFYMILLKFTFINYWTEKEIWLKLAHPEWQCCACIHMQTPHLFPSNRSLCTGYVWFTLLPTVWVDLARGEKAVHVNVLGFLFQHVKKFTT